MATNETQRFNWPIPAWNADWQKWQEVFQDLIRNIEATVFANMSNMKLIMKQLPNVEITEPTPGNYVMSMDGDAIFVSRNHLTEIRLAAEQVTLKQNSVLGLAFTPGAVGPQSIGWEVYEQGVDNAPEVIPVGYVDDLYNIIWYNGAELAAGGGPQGLFEFVGGGGSSGDKVRVSASDTLQNFLGLKVAAGANIVLTTLNPGGNEQLQISAPGVSLPTGEGDVYVDQLNGSDISGDGSIGNPFQTLGYAVDTVVAAGPPTNATEYQKPCRFILAPGGYDHSGTHPSGLQLPYRMTVQIVTNGLCGITGDLLWYQDPTLYFGTGQAGLYIGGTDPASAFMLGDIICMNNNPTASYSTGYRALGIDKITLNGSIYNKKAGTTTANEGTGDLFVTSLHGQWLSPSSYIFGEGEDNTIPTADENRIVFLAYDGVIRNSFHGNIVVRNFQNCWLYGDIKPDYDPVLATGYDGRCEGWGDKSFLNTVFYGGTYVFGNTGGRTGAATDIYFDANSWASVSTHSPTFTDNAYVLEDDSAGVALDSSGYSGILVGATSAKEAFDKIDASDIWSSDAVVVVSSGGTPTANGVNLKAAYTAAKALTPGGNPLAADNRAAVYVPTGVYNIGTLMALDAEFVDIVGMGSPARRTEDGTIIHSDVLIVASHSMVFYQTVRDVRIANCSLRQDAPSGYVMVINNAVNYADRSLYKGMSFYATAFPTVGLSDGGGSGRINARFEDCHSDLAFITRCNFGGIVARCTGGAGSFAGNDSGSAFDLIFDGYAEDCDAGGYSFAGTNGGGSCTFSGTAKRCRVATNGFGSSLGGTGPYGVICSGELTDCDNGSVAGSGSFGFCEHGDGSFTGTARRCRSGDYSFGSSVDNRGNVSSAAELFNCDGGSYCFGYSTSDRGSFDGKASECTGINYCFGASQAPSAGIAGRVESTAKLSKCECEQFGFGASGPTPAGNDKFFGEAVLCRTNLGYGFACNGDFAGICWDCFGAAYCFGGTGGTTTQDNKGLFRCIASQVLHQIGIRNAVMIRDSQFRFHSSLTVSSFIITDDSIGYPVFHQTEIQCTTGGPVKAIDASALRSARITYCNMARPIGENVTNLIGVPNNVVDLNVRQ